jgi:hypothetical protein
MVSRNRRWRAVEHSSEQYFKVAAPGIPQPGMQTSLRFCYNLEGNQHFHNPYEYGSLLVLRKYLVEKNRNAGRSKEL